MLRTRAPVSDYLDRVAPHAPRERIAGRHADEWLARTDAIAAMWDVDTIVVMIRSEFERAVIDAAG